MSFLSLKGISKSFGDNTSKVLNNINLEVKKGEIYAIVGESGCGKTTLLKIIAGLEDASHGEVYLEKQKVLGPSLKLVPGHKDIKMVHQDSALQPNFTIQENILYQLKHYRDEYKYTRLELVIESCKLDEYRHRFPRQLSGGQKQRAAIGTALADNPSLLLLDEPFSNLDVIYKQEVLNTMGELAQMSDTTIIVVTHDIKDAYYLASTIALMSGGTILQIGSAKQLYKEPISPQAAKLTGLVNIVPSSLLVNKGEFKHEVIGIRPENIRFCKKNESIWEGTIVDQKFLGPYYSTTVELNDLYRINVHSRNLHDKLGSTTYLTFSPKSVITFQS